MKFLVVDDSITMRSIICSYLNKMGHKDITEADDGEMAFLQLKEASFSEAPIDFVITDWVMPNMNGLELLKKIKDDGDLKKIPVLMVTAEGNPEYIQAAIDNKAIGIIVKPFSFEELQKKIFK